MNSTNNLIKFHVFQSLNAGTYSLVINNLKMESLKTELQGLIVLIVTKYTTEIDSMPLVLACIPPLLFVHCTFFPFLSKNCENRNILSKQQSHQTSHRTNQTSQGEEKSVGTIACMQEQLAKLRSLEEDASGGQLALVKILKHPIHTVANRRANPFLTT